MTIRQNITLPGGHTGTLQRYWSRNPETGRAEMAVTLPPVKWSCRARYAIVFRGGYTLHNTERGAMNAIWDKMGAIPYRIIDRQGQEYRISEGKLVPGRSIAGQETPTNA